ncbi:THO complex subunit 7 homolog isoform X2 [Episyrphus balteatus]|uniref:THO complex subunit 7 homolog isoform X2 n=1 Tax=Episyrphus balteatus TaxID=286459 RepID=UPI002486AF6A|nr:THO complex subunit 7 homolog isoform X2 [Episyrphus balteatus]
MTDDEVIKRRLLIDGDGTGDDRRLNILLKTFIKWCSTKNDTPENNQIIYDRLLAQLAQCTFAATKSQTIEKMIQQELKNYETLSNSIEASIELANKEIETSKDELVLAKKIRKNRMEYDVLAKVIQTQPDREETSKKLETLKTELKNLEEEEIRLNRKLDYRKKNFYLLMHSIRELQSKLDDSSSEDEQYDDESIDRMSEDEENFWEEIKSNDVDCVMISSDVANGGTLPEGSAAAGVTVDNKGLFHTTIRA